MNSSPYSITCHPLGKKDSCFFINHVTDYELTEEGLSLGFELITLKSIESLIDSFRKNQLMLFNFIFSDEKLYIKSFVGKFNSCTLFNKNIYLKFSKEDM